MPRYRMIHVDHYMSRPIVPFDDLKSEISGKPVSKVPVIRIFGADSLGRKICIHVHGFYPYISIQNLESNELDLIERVVTDIERAVVDSFDETRKNRSSKNDGAKSSSATNVPIELQDHDTDSNLGSRIDHSNYNLSADQRYPIHRVEQIKTFNYYGYHNKPEEFSKLHLYNPRMVKQIAAILESGRVLDRFVPVFWAHLPYILLFFIDNNLRGMQFIEVDQVYWRKGKAPAQSDTAVSLDVADRDKNLSNKYSYLDAFTTEVDSVSTCELEADIRFEWILNGKKFGTVGNDRALRELWLDDQEETQSSRLLEVGLPLYELERNYIEQLCQFYGVDYDALNLEITERERPLRPKLSDEFCGDSDDSLDIVLEDREDQSILSPGELSNHDSAIKLDQNEADEFSDDEEFMRNFTGIEALSGAQTTVKLEHQIKTENDIVTQDTPKKVKDEICSASTSRQADKHIVPAGDDEFSDDDEFLNNVLKIEANIKRYSDNSMIDGKSILNSCSTKAKSGSQYSSSSSREAVSHEYQYLCFMSMELHVSTRDQLRPDPKFDPIEAIFYCVRNDIPDTSVKQYQIVGMIMTDPFREVSGGNESHQISLGNSINSPSVKSSMSFQQKLRSLLFKTGLSLGDVELNIVDTEQEIITTLVDIVKCHDPEILVGYEMERLSWGYILERATVLNVNVSVPLSRITESSLGNNSKYVESMFVQPIMFTGRMVFSTWRIIRHDINLNTCSYERIHHHALSERIPCFSFATLTSWFNQNRNRWRVIDYYLTRVVGQMRILEKFDVFTKVSELARVYGTQFIDVITRGSQIGIESMMLRLAKLQNLTPLSPTVKQRNKMRAPEALPLVMEPETNIYYDPVIVLDFQSLYPSVVIAYNYCYSTCLGRVSDLETKEKFSFGCSQLFIEEDEMKQLLASNNVHISPCGVAFVKKNIRHGILPKMLSELILTRAMVKDQMKKNMKSERPNRRLQRILDHRQHGLKMMANTTYGYTGASYTGRMPCVEIADSIVSKGRETLENAIELVESRPEWGSKVIYGDTDSIFIQLSNCDRSTAFKRAYEMVDAITRANPYPIKMKFEKVYQPCVLQTKKRYCGFKYESPDQISPEFEVKGMETIRRDCCPAAARMLEMALRIQFTTRDINQVKSYVQHQFVKIMSGKLSNIQDFIFARQYKPRDSDKTESVFVPAWQITKRLLQSDPRAEPRFKERVPFIIIYGEPKTPLVNLAKTPIEVLENHQSYRINSDYYIQKIICPTLNRVFCTMKVDTLNWYKSMPHHNVIHRSHYLIAQKNLQSGASSSKQSTMSQYFCPSHCPICAKSIPISDDICDDCRKNLQSSVIRISEEITKNQRKLYAYHQLCRACSSLERCNINENSQDEFYNPCISYDCQNLFRYHQAKLDATNSNFLSQILKSSN